jgi:phenylacetate-coenzyme A ligase PaaK-like adenylate-forming protein
LAARPSGVRRQAYRLQDYRAALRIAGQLKSREDAPPRAIRSIQQAGLDRLVRHAVQHSDFYRDLYSGVDLNGPVDLGKLPVVSKAMLMDNFDLAVTDKRVRRADIENTLAESGGGYYLDRYLVHASTGSSGAKGTFLLDRYERQYSIAVEMRRWSWMSERVGRGAPAARFGVTADGHPTDRWSLRHRWPHRQLVLDYRDSLRNWVAALNSFQPASLRGFASSIVLLAAEQLDGRLCIQPVVVVTSGEVCSEDMEASIARAWDLKSYTEWGCSEGGLLAADCSEHQGLHLFEELAIVEVVDERNEPVPAGVSGDKLLLTNLGGYGLPRIRYELLDFVARLEATCACGRTLPLIDVKEGRSEDTLYLPGRDGGQIRIHPDACRNQIASVPGIKEHQVIYDGKELTVLAVLRDEAVHEVASTIAEKLRQSLAREDVVAPEIAVEIVDSDRIERDPRHPSKLRLVIDRTQRATAGQPHG